MFGEHVGEVEVDLSAPTEAGIFAAALDAFADLVEADATGSTIRRTIELTERDRSLLLVDWLNELLCLTELEQLVPAQVVSVEVEGDTLHAAIDCTRGTPRPLVKGIALGDLAFAPEGSGWHAHVVFDV